MKFEKCTLIFYFLFYPVSGSFLLFCSVGTNVGNQCKVLDCLRFRMQSVDYDFTEIPTCWRVNLFVAAAQFSLPTKQPYVLKLPSQCKANSKVLTTISVNNSPVAVWVDCVFRYKIKRLICLSVKSEQRNVKRFNVESRRTKALGVRMRHRKQRPAAVM